MRLLIAGIGFSLVLAGCGGSSATITPSPSAGASASPTAALTITQTPSLTETEPPGTTALAGSSCSASNLAAAITATGVAAGTEYYTIGISNTGATACTLTIPPSLGFADASHTPISVLSDQVGPDCGSLPIDYQACVSNAPIELQPGAPTPSGSVLPGQVTVTIAIANALNFDPEPTPTFQASYILFTFAGAGDFVTVPFAQPVTLIPSGQVRLAGYGPASTP
jgi:hypothetical protein